MEKVKGSQRVFRTEKESLIDYEIQQELDRRTVEFCRNPHAVALWNAIIQLKLIRKYTRKLQ